MGMYLYTECGAPFRRFDVLQRVFRRCATTANIIGTTTGVCPSNSCNWIALSYIYVYIYQHRNLYKYVIEVLRFCLCSRRLSRRKIRYSPKMHICHENKNRTEARKIQSFWFIALIFTRRFFLDQAGIFIKTKRGSHVTSAIASQSYNIYEINMWNRVIRSIYISFHFNPNIAIYTKFYFFPETLSQLSFFNLFYLVHDNNFTRQTKKFHFHCYHKSKMFGKRWSNTFAK